uniref:Mab-21-like HhH/H2TH-like domain-containing protein n=2 Tax=Photinus pyralis TaxID=7054 RepID=A0A1Y1M6Y2_PHOPY
MQDHEKELLLPDVILNHVGRKIKLETTDGELQPLVSQRMYILHNNIEVVNKTDPNYSRIDNSYRAEMEESRPRGFVKLNVLGTPRGSHSRHNSIDFQSTDNDVKHSLNRPSTSRDTDVNDAEYGYTTITALKTLHSVDVSKTNIYTNTAQFPKKCISEKQVKNLYGSEWDSDEDDCIDSSETQVNESSLFVTRYYLNSTEFMEHFTRNVFPNYLAAILEFPSNFIKQTKSIYGALYCDSIDCDNNKIRFEIVPVIPIGWPQEIVFEWYWRERVTVSVKRGRWIYKWPTDNMIQEIQSLSCVLTPKGFAPKKFTNPEMQIEWEIHFPKAERYLELTMSHAQMRCYLFLVILFRKLIEPKTQTHGILVEHIRHLMFWECESNYCNWPEHRLGAKLLLILQNLLNSMSKQKLPHYFIRNKNLLYNIPTKYLISTMEILQNAIQEPVLSFIASLKHLRYTSPKFYSAPDLQELHKIIKSENVYDSNVQETIVASEVIQSQSRGRNNETEPKKKRNKEEDWDRRYLQSKLQKNIQKLKRNGEIAAKRLAEQSDEVSIRERFHNDIARQIRLLEFFIHVFRKISEKSSKIASTHQTQLYLKQAWCLTKVLEDIDKEGALTLQERIRAEEEKFLRRKTAETHNPGIPKRNTILNSKGVESKVSNLVTDREKMENGSATIVDIHDVGNKNVTDYSTCGVLEQMHEGLTVHNDTNESPPLKALGSKIIPDVVEIESTNL